VVFSELVYIFVLGELWAADLSESGSYQNRISGDLRSVMEMCCVLSTGDAERVGQEI